MSRRRPRSLRVRITLAFLTGALVLSGFVSVSTYLLAERYLTRLRVGTVTRQSFNSLRFATEYLSTRGGDTGDASLAHLAELLETRGDADVVLLAGTRSVASSVSLTRETVPSAVRRVVDRGDVGWLVAGEDPRRLVLGSPVPGAAVQAFFVYPLELLDETLALLRQILLAVAAVAVVSAGVIARRAARQVTEPLSRVSDAARRVAEGVLETRLEETGRDELGVLANSFNEMAHALQQRIAREHRFVADVSHELRTPLTALRASVDFLVAHDEGLDAPARSSLRVAAREVAALQRLVDDLLELSRMESGVVEVGQDKVELGDFAREAVRRRAEGHDVRVVAPPERLVVRTDKHRLERVVGNLIENAVVHGLARDVAVEVALAGGQPTIAVSDAGPGIAPEELARAFEPFWRGDQARRRSPRQGSGLGLAIAKENAALLGAHIGVASSPGSTRFTVRLPAESYVGGRGSGE